MDSYGIERKLADLERQLFQKAEKYEPENRLAKIRSDVDRLERSVGEIRAENDELRSRMQELQARSLT